MCATGGVGWLDGVVDSREPVADVCVGVAVLMGNVEFLEKELDSSARLKPLMKLVFCKERREKEREMREREQMFALYYTTTFVYFKLTISCCEQNTLDCILTFRPNETIKHFSPHHYCMC